MIYQVVHSTLGRYRICVPKLASDEEFASKLETLIESIAFVTEVRLNRAAKSLVVSYKTRTITETTALEQLVGCIYRAQDLDIPAEPETQEETDLIPEVNQWQDLSLPVLSLVLSLLVVPLEIPPLIVIVAIAGAAMPWFNRAADRAVNHQQASIDLMDWVWMAAQTLRGQYAAPALKTVLVETRRTLRGNTTQTREQQASHLLDELNAREMRVGDRVTFRGGEMISVDGQILEGVGLISLENLTGATTPSIYSLGQDVYASTTLLEGQIVVLVQRTGANTRAGLAACLTQLAPVHDTEIGAQQAELARNIVLPTLAFGGAVFVLTGNIGAAISPYQLDFGSGIPISLSTTIVQALTYAARQGIYIRSGGVLETLARVDTVVFERVELLAPDDAATIATLHGQNINIYLIDREPASTEIELAQRLGICRDRICAGADVSEQIPLVRALRHQGKIVASVGTQGDESTDANISIVFASSSEIDRKTADVVILNDDIRGITHAIAIAKRAMASIYENTATIVIPNLFMQIGGGMILGWHPVSNVIVNNGSAFIAEFLSSPRPLFAPGEFPLLENRSGKRTKKKQAAKLPAASGSPVSFGAREKQSALKQKDLAKRLGVASQFLTRYRFKPDFSAWTQARDPEGMAWHYDNTARCYRQSLP